MNNQLIVSLQQNTISNFKLPQDENNKSNSKHSLGETDNLNYPTKRKTDYFYQKLE